MCITSSELRELDVKEVKDLLLSEKASMEVWYSVLMEYWRLGENKNVEVNGKEVSSKFENLLRDTLNVKNVPLSA